MQNFASSKGKVYINILQTSFIKNKAIDPK